jgi:NADH:ubiquinone oxidoreductase subunit 5 (subunit L)/multisubunit Na+/H+ antiporter MnhA subunit
VAICGLPPLNGFASELLIYFGAFKCALSEQTGVVIPALGLVIGLALIGGLAAACFARAFGIVFLGEPRSEHAAHAHEVGQAMRIPMLVLAATCVVIGLTAPRICQVMIRVVGDIADMEPTVVANIGSNLTSILSLIVVASVALIVLAGVIVILRCRLLNGREITEAGTWDCGYPKPDARMQYTASSFAQPLTKLFRGLLGTREFVSPPRGLFPKDVSFISETTDVFKKWLFKPVFTAVESAVGRMRWLQHGRLQLYVLYIAATLLVLLIWKL